jgi:hypothetical protein
VWRTLLVNFYCKKSGKWDCGSKFHRQFNIYLTTTLSTHSTELLSPTIRENTKIARHVKTEECTH